MTDKELLEAAAKAAGIPLEWDECPDASTFRTDDESLWNPLRYQGDAMGLCVCLHMMINIEHGETEVAAHPSISDGHSIVELHNGDAAAATRRAIVRCAAGDYA